MPRIVAFFTCSVVCVAASLPVHAEEKGGIVEQVDREAGIVVLSDGSRYLLPQTLDRTVVEPGMEVHLLVANEASMTARHTHS